jgi:nucleoside-diphosphate-sugar epimerase
MSPTSASQPGPSSAGRQRTVLVTGGSGYFGSILADLALARGDRVRIFDLNPPGPRAGDAADRVEYVAGDVRDLGALRAASAGADVVLNNVAQVPLAKDRDLFWSVNVTGTANVLLAARDRGVPKVVHTSSSAIFGVPESNPVTEETPGRPLEAYGRAKLEAEHLCHDASDAGLDVSIVRPRTILGHGRLGIIAVLFEFVAEGAPLYVLGRGDNRYQFVHANDLADAVLRAADREKPAIYNIGATEFGTMRETLEALAEHAGTGSRVRSLPAAPARIGMRALAQVGLAPFAPYHWLLYAESLWFDTTKAQSELGWSPRHSNASAVIESYDWFLANRASLGATHGSHHQSPVKLGLLKVLKRLP